jgi:hypothetical protein
LRHRSFPIGSSQNSNPFRIADFTKRKSAPATARKYQIAPFSIARRAEARFSEDKYYSEAPLPTDMHISLLEEFEESIKRIGKK